MMKVGFLKFMNIHVKVKNNDEGGFFKFMNIHAKVNGSHAPYPPQIF
jgi:hypothetical protein